jgi:hypothetical protein
MVNYGQDGENTMSQPDQFTESCNEILDGVYSSLDRIVVNAYFRLGHSGGGFRLWWRKLHGSDETLDTTHLMRLAGHFSRSVRAWGKRRGVPIIDCRTGERKHEIAEEYIPQDPTFRGVFLVLVAKSPTIVWDVKPCRNGQIHLEKKWPQPYVNHYSFHIMDGEWGHLTIKMSGHPPFDVQIILNGHEWIERQLRKRRIEFTKEGNSFTGFSGGAALDRIADTLNSLNSIGRLSEVCDRWIYTACLSFALDTEEQERTGFHYDYSSYQVEYSRNLLFKRGREMEEIYQSLIDRTRKVLNIRTVRTIMGSKYRPSRKRMKTERFQVSTEKPAYDLTVFKIHYGKLTLKIYDKGGRLLRVEVIVHNTKAMKLGRSLEKLPLIVSALREILNRFLNTVHCVSVRFLSDAYLDELAAPTLKGRVRLAGLNVLTPRSREAIDGLLAVSLQPLGFSTAQFAAEVRGLTGRSALAYGMRQAAYDLRKMRGKRLVERVGRSRRYRVVLETARPLFSWLILNDKVIRPLVHSVGGPSPNQSSVEGNGLDHHLFNVRRELTEILATLDFAS